MLWVYDINPWKFVVWVFFWVSIYLQTSPLAIWIWIAANPSFANIPGFWRSDIDQGENQPTWYFQRRKRGGLVWRNQKFKRTRPRPAFSWLGLDGSSGGYSSHGYIKLIKKSEVTHAGSLNDLLDVFDRRPGFFGPVSPSLRWAQKRP